jgi:hypothetical protein
MNLTQNFTLAELTRSDYARRHGLDNSATPDIIDNLRKLAGVLERVRLACGAPVIVSSGYRSPAVNAGVGGSRSSAHMQGMAADFTVLGQTPKQTAQVLATLASQLDFDQLILEFDAWVHIGIADKPRRQVLTATRKNGGVVYLGGIV